MKRIVRLILFIALYYLGRYTGRRLLKLVAKKEYNVVLDRRVTLL